MRELTYVDALREALREEMLRDERVFLIGEDIAAYGGAFGVTKGFLQEFGAERIRNTPMSEMAIVGAATGAALMGLKPVAEIMFMDFLTICLDQLQNNAATFRYISNGQFRAPLVLRMPAGGGRGYGATHSKTLDALLLHIPGLIIACPSTPHDAKGLLKSALRQDDRPVAFVEHKLLYKEKGLVPEGDYTVPFGKAEVRKEGNDITIIAHSFMNRLALEAAADLGTEGVSAEVIDPRTLAPLDFETIAASVRKTGKVLVVEEGFKTGGVGAEISARIAEQLLDYLDAPVARVAGIDAPIPCCPSLERICIPSKGSIVSKVKELCTK